MFTYLGNARIKLAGHEKVGAYHRHAIVLLGDLKDVVWRVEEFVARKALSGEAVLILRSSQGFLLVITVHF
jgi:hypothetical protein